VQLLSGVVNGHTTGTAIALLIEDQKPRRPACGSKPGGGVHERMNVRMII